MSSRPYDPLRVLLLGDTAEARDIARALHDAPDVALAASAPGYQGERSAIPAPLLLTDFGSCGALADYLRAARVGAVLDASHPFSADIAARNACASVTVGVPRARVVRPPWRPRPGDRWHDVADEASVARLVPADATVFVATGRERLDGLHGLAPAGEVLVRRRDIDGDLPPLANARFVHERPPYTVESETALFRTLGVGWLVLRNGGGSGARPKLDAARALGIEVAMLRRPAPPPGPCVETAYAALDWLRTLR